MGRDRRFNWIVAGMIAAALAAAVGAGVVRAGREPAESSDHADRESAEAPGHHNRDASVDGMGAMGAMDTMGGRDADTTMAMPTPTTMAMPMPDGGTGGDALALGQHAPNDGADGGDVVRGTMLPAAPAHHHHPPPHIHSPGADGGAPLAAPTPRAPAPRAPMAPMPGM